MPVQVAISGASGLVGGALAESLRSDGHVVRPMVRTESPEPGAIRWDPEDLSIDAAALEGLDAVVHLAGAGIGDKRWSESYKRTIIQSRSRGTDLIARTLAEHERPPRVFVSGSGIHYYGSSRGDEVRTEASPRGQGFLSDVVVAWEEATEPAEAAGIRTVRARTAPVQTRRGGVLTKMLPLFRLGLGGPFGAGRQWMSWISLTDEVRALRFLIDNESVSGPVNLSAPQPVTNKEFAKALGRALHRPAVLPVPSFGPRLVLGREMADELLFSSIRAEPEVLSSAGYTFVHPDIDSGLRGALDG